MKRLNERGWGLAAMLAFLVVFFLAIIIVAILSSTMGIGGNEHLPVPSTHALIRIEP